MKIKQHDHWDMSLCSVCNRIPHTAEYEDIHEDFIVLKGAVEDYLDAYTAKESLKSGFKGMGYNIQQEKAAGLNHYLRLLKDMVGHER